MATSQQALEERLGQVESDLAGLEDAMQAQGIQGVQGAEGVIVKEDGKVEIPGGGGGLVGKTEDEETGKANTALGVGAGFAATDDTAIGFNALKSDAGGTNTAIGYRAMEQNTEGKGNTALGCETLVKNTTGVNNTALGEGAMHENETGELNTAVGAHAMENEKSGSRNTAIGEGAMHEDTEGKENTAVGQFALSGVSGAGITSNTAIGCNAMGGVTLAKCEDCTAIGTGAMAHATGEESTALGAFAGNECGEGCVMLGYKAGFNEEGSYKLYISHGETSEPLIKGDFAEKELQLFTTKLGFFGVSAVTRPHVGAESGGVLGEDTTLVNALRAALINLGLVQE